MSFLQETRIAGEGGGREGREVEQVSLKNKLSTMRNLKYLQHMRYETLELSTTKT